MMSFLIVRGLDAADGLEVWKIKAVDIVQWSRVLYSAKGLVGRDRRDLVAPTEVALA